MKNSARSKPRKKLCIIFSSIILLTACGSVSKSTKPLDLADDYKAKIEICEDDFTATGDIRRCGANMWECTFTSPDTINGMTLAKSSNEWIISHEGINYTISEEKMPTCSMINLVVGTIDKLIAKKDLVCVKKENVVRENGVIDGQDFSATFKDQKLATIEIADTIVASFK